MTPNFVRSMVILSSITLLGCTAETFGADDPVVDPTSLQVISGVRLAGSTITISAPWMAQAADSLWFAVDDAPAIRSGRDPDHPSGFHLVLAPTLATGRHEIFLRAGGGDRILIGAFDAGGFAELRYATGSLYGGEGETQPLPELMEVAGAGAPDSGGSLLVVLDVRTAQMRPAGQIPICCYGVGASYRPGAFLAYRGTGNSAWNPVSS